MNLQTAPVDRVVPGCVELRTVAVQCLTLLGQWDRDAASRVSLQVSPAASVSRSGNARHVGLLLMNWLHAGLCGTTGGLQLQVDAQADDPEWVRVVLSSSSAIETAGAGQAWLLPGADPPLELRPLPDSQGVIGGRLRLPPLARLPEEVPGLRVLLVEDNLINAETTREMLCSASDIRVQVAHTGAQALAALSQQAFDIVLMDMFLPDTDGVVLTRRIRRTLAGQAPVIVALTANAYPSDRELCISAGMADFLVKPVSLARLQETVRRWAPATPASIR